MLFNPSHECVFHFHDSVYDFSSDSTTFESLLTNGTLKAASTLCADSSQAVCGQGLAFIYTEDGECLFSAAHFEQTEAGGSIALKYTSQADSSLLVTLECDWDQATPAASELQLSSQTPGEYSMRVTYDQNCPLFTYNKFAQVLIEQAWAFGAIFMVFGLSLAIFGLKFFEYFSFVFAFLIVCLGFLLLCYSTFWQPTETVRVNRVFVTVMLTLCAVLFGTLAGIVCAKNKRFSAAVAAGWCGYVFSQLLEKIWWDNYDSLLVNLTSEVVLVVVLVSVSLIWYNQAIMAGTAFAGSYLTVRGISFYAGGFTNEYVLMHRFGNNDTTAWKNPQMWGYFSAVIALSVATVCA